MAKVVRASFVGKEVFVGIDVHKRSYAVVAVEAGGRAFRVGSMPAEPDTLVTFLRKRFEGAVIRSAYEAGFSGFVLHRVLEKAGIRNLVVNPSSIPVVSRDRVKTDRRDAEKLALLLSRDLLETVRVPTPEEELKRVITRTREQVIRDRTRVGLRIKSKLTQFGLISSEDQTEVSLKWLTQVGQMKLPSELGIAIEVLVVLYRTLDEQRKTLEEQMKLQAENESEQEKIYRSVPGVGRISARTLANELGDMSRFRNQEAIYSFTGLTPAEFSSGEHVRRGHISRQGSSRLRAILVECAWRAITKDPSLRVVYERLKITRGGKKAIVAVARRLIGRIRACLVHRVEYRLAA